MAFKKIAKDFVLSDSSVNVYGFKLLTTGVVLDEVLKNPIGYYMHLKDADGILLKWENVRVVGDAIMGQPCINLEHPRGERTVTEVEEGFLNAASVGSIVLLDYTMEETEDPEHPMVVGTKWYYKECSLVESPGNRNAFGQGKEVAELCDAEGNVINLSDLKAASIKNVFSNQNDSCMKRIELPINAALIGLLNLGDEPKAEDVVKGIQDLHDAKTAAVKDLADFKTTQANDQVKAILEKGLADKKFTVGAKDVLARQYAGKPVELKELVDNMQAYVPITSNLSDANTLPADLKDKTYDELDKANKIERLKNDHPEHFATIYKAKFGKEYGG